MCSYAPFQRRSDGGQIERGFTERGSAENFPQSGEKRYRAVSSVRQGLKNAVERNEFHSARNGTIFLIVWTVRSVSHIQAGVEPKCIEKPSFPMLPIKRQALVTPGNTQNRNGAQPNAPQSAKRPQKTSRCGNIITQIYLFVNKIIKFFSKSPFTNRFICVIILLLCTDWSTHGKLPLHGSRVLLRIGDAPSPLCCDADYIL